MTRVHAIVGTTVCALMLISAVPAWAERSPVPNNPNIVDPAGDANGLGTIGRNDPLPHQYNDGVDILAAWFTQDRVTITASIHLGAPPPSVPHHLGYYVRAVPDPAHSVIEPGGIHSIYCLTWGATFPGTGDGALVGRTGFFYDGCSVSEPTDSPIYYAAKVRVRELADGTAVVSIEVHRLGISALEPGQVLSRPRAITRSGVRTTTIWPGVHYDFTVAGADFRMR